MILAAPVAAAPPASWTQLAPYPTPIANNAVTSVCADGTCSLYSFMGIVDPADANTITAASYRLVSPGTGPWEPIADAPLLNGRAKIAASAVTVAGEVYLIGGYTVNGFSETTEHRLFRYAADTGTYVQLADPLTGVDDTVAVVFQDRYIYLISGWHGPINNSVRAVQRYDTVNNVWLPATSIPFAVAPRFGHAGGIVGNRIVFIDGAITSGASFVPSHDTLVGTINPINLSSINWQVRTVSPVDAVYRAANSLGTTPCGEVVFVGGSANPYNFDGNGYNGQPSFPIDAVTAYDPAADAWRVIDDGGTFGSGSYTPTMDHRGLARFDGRWVTIGGMIAPETATATVNALLIPEPGDFDGDGAVAANDVPAFVDALLINSNEPAADMDCDGDADGDDIAGFVAALAG